MKLKYQFEFELNRMGIKGAIVQITVMSKKHWLSRWEKDQTFKAECTGFNGWTGAEWSYEGGGRLPAALECEINPAAQKAAMRGIPDPSAKEG
ncbi:hypothetical protein SNQ56_002091 [Cronobacter muytjensii]|nr:hypothetical protein [Cronobacter muytjensii]